MSEFDKHWDEWAIASNCTEDEVKSHFEAGQQSQKGEVDRLQTKIDYMQVRLDGANERALSILNHKNVMVDKMQAKIDELQKRIDDASNKIDFWVGGKNGDAIHVAKSIGNILKGNKDEN